MLVCDTVIIITDRRIASDTVGLFNLQDTVRIKCILIVNDRMECNDISFF